MMVLIFTQDSVASSDEAFAAAWRAIKIIDDYVIIGAAGSSLVSGCVLAWGTPWGFFKWNWVATKFIATLILVSFGAFFLGPWINKSALISAKHGLAANDSYQLPHALVSSFGTLQIVALILIFVISIFKPWGKTRKRIASTASHAG